MLSYNLSTVKKLGVFKKSVSYQWSYVPAHTKFFGLFKIPSYFFNLYTWKHEGQEECPSNYYLEKERVFQDPHIIMWFIDGSDRKFYFKTPEEAIIAAEDVKKRSGCEWYEHK